VVLSDGDAIVLKFDMRLVSTSATVDRNFRFGLYTDSSTFTSGDRSSTDTSYLDDVGYMARVDLGPDTSNSTTMDVVRDDSNTATILGSTATALSPSLQSTDTANQIVDANKHHFVMTLTRSGSNMMVSLQQDSNAALTGTEKAVVNLSAFTFNEVMLTARSNALTDYRFDNIEVDYTPAVPEPTGLAALATAAAGMLVRRKIRR
jgi:hypothetical protein